MAQMSSEYHRARRRRLIAEGRCRNCLARPADDGYSSCGRCREKARDREAARRAAGTQHYDRETWRDRRYGLRPGQFDAMVNRQGNECAICRKDMGTGRGRHIDHDHKSGKVRGLLCAGCNTALGRLELVGVAAFLTYLGEDLTREETEARLDELLALERPPQDKEPARG